MWFKYQNDVSFLLMENVLYAALVFAQKPHNLCF